jgi:hypothetical protein
MSLFRPDGNSIFAACGTVAVQAPQTYRFPRRILGIGLPEAYIQKLYFY